MGLIIAVLMSWLGAGTPRRAPQPGIALNRSISLRTRYRHVGRHRGVDVLFDGQLVRVRGALAW